MSPLLFPNLVSYRDFNSNWRFLHLDNYLRKWNKSSKTYFEIVSFIYLCVPMSLENEFSQKKIRFTMVMMMTATTTTMMTRAIGVS